MLTRRIKQAQWAMSTNKIVEGVFAVNKPQGLSSAEVLNRLQRAFNPSKLFAPWIRRAADVRDQNQKHNKKAWRKKTPNIDVKMGHGGTLDPLATGVLIVAIGKYTKELSQFLHCTKTYDAIILFGCATATYDRVGKVIGKKPYGHINREMVEEALKKFRGKIVQRPPIYSALRHKGKRLYEYAREGKELPIDIKDREVEVHNLEILEWYEGGTHEYRFPAEEANEEDKVDAEILAHAKSETGTSREAVNPDKTLSEHKRKAETELIDNDALQLPDAKRPKGAPTDTEDLLVEGEPTEIISEKVPKAVETSNDSIELKHDDGSLAPAAKIRMTVSSGFYVRSLCHDLGEAVNSHALMSELVRTRQAQFELEKNVFEFSQLKNGEEAWSGEVEKLLDEYVSKT